MKLTRAELKKEIEQMIPSFSHISIDGFRGRGYIKLGELEAIRNELILLRRN